MSSAPPGRTHVGTQALALSNAMVQLMNRYTGRGPTRTRTTINTNVVVVAFQDTLTRGERNLVEARQLESVRRMRRTFHDLMRGEAIAAVEEILDREVQAYLTDIDLEANCAAMVFMLVPRPETGHVETGEV